MVSQICHVQYVKLPERIRTDWAQQIHNRSFRDPSGKTWTWHGEAWSELLFFIPSDKRLETLENYGKSPVTMLFMENRQKVTKNRQVHFQLRKLFHCHRAISGGPKLRLALVPADGHKDPFHLSETIGKDSWAELPKNRLQPGVSGVRDSSIGLSIPNISNISQLIWRLYSFWSPNFNQNPYDPWCWHIS